MTSRRQPTLAERARVPSAPGERECGRHCWVVDAPGHAGRWPGLLVEWRRTGDHWEGRVVYAIPEIDAAGARVIERWLGAEYLTAGT